MRRGRAARTRCSASLTDYANGVTDEATPVETLIEMMARLHRGLRRRCCGAALPLRPPPPAPPGIVYRFESGGG